MTVRCASAVSPFFVRSSSTPGYRDPTITPPSTNSTEHAGAASDFPSSGLPSPSALFLHHHIELGNSSGSQLHQLPEGANTGLANAANCFRLLNCNAEAQNADAEEITPPAKTSKEPKKNRNREEERRIGRPNRPKKAAKSPDTAVGINVAVVHCASSSREQGMALPHTQPAKACSPSMDLSLHQLPDEKPLPSSRNDLNAEMAGEPVGKAKKQALSICGLDCTLQAEIIHAGTIGIARDLDQPAVKSRKRAVEFVDPSTPLLGKKPRKKKVKSLEIIINSDATDVDYDASTSIIPEYNATEAAREPTISIIGRAATKNTGKPRAKMTNTENASAENPKKQTKIRKAKVVKPKAKTWDVEMSEYFENAKPTNSDKENVGSEAGRTSEQIRKRRLSWTPAKNTEAPLTPQSRPDSADTGIFPSSAGISARCLADVLGNMKYADAPSARAPSPRSASSKAITKRCRIQLADPATVNDIARRAHRPSPVKRTRAPPKKPQTITALVTAAYKLVEPAAAAQSMTSMFSPDIVDAAVGGTVDSATLLGVTKKPRKSRAKSAGSSTIKTKKAATSKSSKLKAKTDEHMQTLYPPEISHVRAANQDFIFGTSSQLAVEESPSFIRQIQQAVHESEGVPESQATATPLRMSCGSVPTAPHGTCLSICQAERALWCESARDFEKGMLATSVVASILESQAHNLAPSLVRHVEEPPANTDPERQPRFDAKSSSAQHSPPSMASEQAREGQRIPFGTDQPPLLEMESCGPRDDGEWVLLKSDDSTYQPEDALALGGDVRSGTAISEIGPLPSSQSALTASKGNIVSLGSYTRVASPQGGSHPTAVLHTSRKRGRARKNIAASTISEPAIAAEWRHIDEISDSDSPTTPSPPRRRATSTLPSVRPLNLVPIVSASIAANVGLFADAASKQDHLQLSSSLLTLFSKITAVIKSPPTSAVPTVHPTWHEKILLYDPIVLEDLTAWLNRQGLRVPVRIKPKFKNRGRRRKHVPPEDELDPLTSTEVGEAEVQAWMVRKWCEENSICCLSKESLRGGAKARY